MKAILAPLLAVPFLFASPELIFAPEAESELSKSFFSEVELALTTVEMIVTIEGEERDVSPEDVPEVIINSTTSIEFTDQYLTVDDGKPTSLLRSFKTAELTRSQQAPGEDGEESTTESEGESELVGSKVSFLWEDDKDAYKIKFVDDDADDRDKSLLSELQVDADFRVLLPKDPVEEGETWNVPASAFDLLGNPSGELHIKTDDEDDDEDAIEDDFRDNLEGEFECTFESVEEGLATIAFTGDIETKVNIEMEELDGAPEGLERSRSMEFAYEIKGKLIWDMDKNRAVSFEMGGPVTMEVLFSQSGPEIPELQGSQLFEGLFKDTAEFE